MNVLIAVDKLGNTLSGGNHNSTISARVGYFSENPKNSIVGRLYWKGLEKIIDFSFKPMDGDNHCHQAYVKEGGNLFIDTGNDWMRFGLSFIIVGSCLGCVIPLVYLSKYIFGLKPKPDILYVVFEERLEATNRQLINVANIFEKNNKKQKSKNILTDKAMHLAEEVKNRIDLIVKLN